VSGGADSMALLAALAAAARGADAPTLIGGDTAGAGRLVAAHFNHGLRGAESDDDATFVVHAAAELEIPSIVGTGDVIGRLAREGNGVEAVARAARYDFLAATAARLGFRYVATAHTLDDQAETVLHRLLRGTGPAGLTGMVRARALVPDTIGLVRPLLEFRRSEIRDYLRNIGRTYREDSSNDDLRFTRNRIRRELLPQLAEEYNPRVVECLARLAGQAEEYREIVDGLVSPVYDRAVIAAGGGTWTIDCSRLSDVPRPVLRELLVRVWTEAGLPLGEMGYEEWATLAAIAGDAGAAARDFPANVAVRRDGERMTATRR
jgi:tRNA(Ile)-lysidine synthase